MLNRRKGLPVVDDQNAESNTECDDCIPDLKTDVEGGMVCTIGIVDSFWTVFVPACNDGVAIIGKDNSKNFESAREMHDLTCSAIESGLAPGDFQVVKDDNKWFLELLSITDDDEEEDYLNSDADDDDATNETKEESNDNFEVDDKVVEEEEEQRKKLENEDNAVVYYSCGENNDQGKNVADGKNNSSCDVDSCDDDEWEPLSEEDGWCF